ncbi:Uncharacterised protein [Clostridium putrefaciens]|uniref:Uncharacterized protein n=1 Tax=Clostridium putrefaciens TaxID=99675 RepID=A0A381J550_9CLOT|nr:ABC-three component system middle component 6 [Clostridium putrefaciens]SUY45727.1 Uncharacterised protein [Clostridium putrefaciens]
MIVPTKHTNFSQSLLGFGSYILESIPFNKSIDELWNQYQFDYMYEVFPAKHSFDNLLLTLVFLHSIGAIEELDGGIIKCN